MRFCFHLALGTGLAAVVACAGSLPDPVRTVKTVVRADASGRLVRSTVITPRVVHENVIPAIVVGQEAPPAVEPPQPPKAPPGSFREAVDRIAERNKLSPQLVHSVIKVESNYN